MSSPIDPEFCKLPCKVLMDRRVPTVESTEKLLTVVKRLMENYSGDIIALDKGQPIGCFNMFDAMRWFAETDVHRNEISVNDVVCTPVISVDLDSSIEDAFGVMNKFGITSLAVTEQGLLKGYITENGIREWMNLYPHYLRFYQSAKQGECGELMNEVLGSRSPARK